MGSRPILITGCSGQVGAELHARFERIGPVAAPMRAELDLLDPAEIQRVVAELHPALVINAAAYTAVDKAEDEPEVADAVNHQAVRAIGEAARAVGAPVIHFSTDYVFDGELEHPWSEDDATGPLSVYGRSKLAGERALAVANPEHIILRTAWVYSPRGSNFLLAILRRALAGEALRVVADRRGTPTSAAAIADGVVAIVEQMRAEGGFAASAKAGIYHMTCGGEATWHEFAEAIVHELTERTGKPAMTVQPIRSEEFLTKAIRPRFSVLSNEKVHRVFGVKLPHWKSALGECMKDVLASSSAASRGY